MAEITLAQPESQRGSPCHLQRSQSASVRSKLPASTIGANLERTKAAKVAAARMAAAKLAVAMHERALVSLSPPPMPPPLAPPLAQPSSATANAARLAWPKQHGVEYYNNNNSDKQSPAAEAPPRTLVLQDSLRRRREARGWGEVRRRYRELTGRCNLAEAVAHAVRTRGTYHTPTS